MTAFEIEILIRKIYHCERFQDPFMRIANADYWEKIFSVGTSISLNASILVTLWRLKNVYLEDSGLQITGRIGMHIDNLENGIADNATLLNILDDVNIAVDNLQLTIN